MPIRIKIRQLGSLINGFMLSEIRGPEDRRSKAAECMEDGMGRWTGWGLEDGRTNGRTFGRTPFTQGTSMM